MPFMKQILTGVQWVIRIICIFIFLAGILLALSGILEFFTAFIHAQPTNAEHFADSVSTGLLKGVDRLLMAIVFFVLSLGIIALFNSSDRPLPAALPEWLRVRSFVELKVILWEAILTTLVVASLATLSENKLNNISVDIQSL